MPKTIIYECELCGSKVSVSPTAETVEMSPIYCCGSKVKKSASGKNMASPKKSIAKKVVKKSVAKKPSANKVTKKKS